MSWNTAYETYGKFNANGTTTKVGFLQTTQAKIDQLIKGTLSGTVEGTFYLTSDSQRLYVGRNTGSKVIPVPVNEGIHIVDYVSTQSAGYKSGDSVLPELTDVNAGEFYYVEKENILCIAGQNNSGKESWIQLNKIATLRNENNIVSVSSTTSNVATIQTSINDTLNNNASGSFNIKGSKNITVSTDNSGNVTIETGDQVDTHYTLSAEDGTGDQVLLKLTSDESSPVTTSVKINGSENVDVDYNASTGITISAQDSKVSELSASFGADGTLSIGAINTIEKDGKTVTTLTAQSATVKPGITIGSTADILGNAKGSDTIYFEDGTADLSDIYTASQVEARIAASLQSYDALKYQGLVSADNAETKLAFATAHNGDVYKVSGPIALANVPGHSGETGNLIAGDLLIAHGTENDNGTLGTGSSGATWEVIPAGDSQVISVGSVSGSHGINILDGSAALGGIKLATDSNGALEFGADSTDADHVTTVTLNHKAQSGLSSKKTISHAAAVATAGNKEPDVNTYKFKTITGLTFDDYGHVTGWSEAESTIKDTHNYLTAGNTVVSVASNKATVTSTITDHDGKSVRPAHTFTSSSLTVGKNANEEITFELNWGTF